MKKTKQNQMYTNQETGRGSKQNFELIVCFLFSACSAVPAIATITNSQSITLVVAGANTYQSVAAVVCISGYAPADAELSCLANGNWETTTCNKVGKLDQVRNYI